MKQAIGNVPIYTIIIIFMVVTFGFLLATLSYMKAYKVNGKIARSLENHEGYNALSDKEIANTLTSIGYRAQIVKCPERNGKAAVAGLANKRHAYCIYEYPVYQQGNIKTKFNYLNLYTLCMQESH